MIFFFTLSKLILVSKIRHNFWQSFKKILYIGFKATLKFEKFKNQDFNSSHSII